MKNKILFVTLFSFMAGVLIWSCTKKNTDTAKQEPKQQVLARQSANLYHISNNDTSLSWDVELMDDYTWSGKIITPESTYVSPSVEFLATPETFINATLQNNVVSFSSIPNGNCNGISFSNFQQISVDKFTFDANYNSNRVTTFTLISNQYSSTNDLMNSFVGNWPTDKNISNGKTTWVWLAARILVAVGTIVTQQVQSHCAEIIKTARQNCNTPPCSFKVSWCSADCNCPNN